MLQRKVKTIRLTSVGVMFRKAVHTTFDAVKMGLVMTLHPAGVHVFAEDIDSIVPYSNLGEIALLPESPELEPVEGTGEPEDEELQAAPAAASVAELPAAAPAEDAKPRPAPKPRKPKKSAA